jgi:hypothetical protein
VIRKILADEGDNRFLGLKVGFGDRVDGPFQGHVLGPQVVLPHHFPRGQGRLPAHRGGPVQQIFIHPHFSFRSQLCKMALW